jgi:hypothetical protein
MDNRGRHQHQHHQQIQHQKTRNQPQLTQQQIHELQGRGSNVNTVRHIGGPRGGPAIKHLVNPPYGEIQHPHTHPHVRVPHHEIHVHATTTTTTTSGAPVQKRKSHDNYDELSGALRNAINNQRKGLTQSRGGQPSHNHQSHHIQNESSSLEDFLPTHVGFPGSAQNLDERISELEEEVPMSEEYLRFANDDINLKVRADLTTNKKAVSLMSKHLPVLKDKLEQIARNYYKQLQEVVADLEGVSGDLKLLVEMYDTNKTGIKWIGVEDEVLKTKDPEDSFFKMLIHNKGIEAVRRRLKFLKINKSV